MIRTHHFPKATFGVLPGSPVSPANFSGATPGELEALPFALRSRRAASFAEPARVTACLLSWKRPGNIAMIVESLRQVDFIDEILIWNNNPDVQLEFDDEKTRVIPSPQNQCCYGRFLCARQARNPHIYVQDDDVINHDIAGLYQRFLNDPTCIAHALSGPHWHQRGRHIHGNSQVALLGWGAIFHRDWLNVLDDLPLAIREDPVFPREADKFFTMVLEKRHNSVVGALTHLDGHSDPIALWRDPQHQQHKAYAVCLTLRFLRLKSNPLLPVPWNVVITCHNYGQYLHEAVESVLNNDADYEICIVDDGSTDETPEIANHLAGRYPHIRYVPNGEQRGAGHSRNRGIAALDSEYVVLLDADDRLGPNYLFQACQHLRDGADVINPDAILFGTRQARWTVPEVTTLEMLLERNFVHCCAAFRRSLWQQVGGIDETMPCWMDYDFWIRLAAAGARIRRLEGDHFFYRQHGASLSNTARELRQDLRQYLASKYGDLLENTAR
jgi:hypothetical protein